MENFRLFREKADGGLLMYAILCIGYRSFITPKEKKYYGFQQNDLA